MCCARLTCMHAKLMSWPMLDKALSRTTFYPVERHAFFPLAQALDQCMPAETRHLNSLVTLTGVVCALVLTRSQDDEPHPLRA